MELIYSSGTGELYLVSVVKGEGSAKVTRLMKGTKQRGLYSLSGIKVPSDVVSEILTAMVEEKIVEDPS